MKEKKETLAALLIAALLGGCSASEVTTPKEAYVDADAGIVTLPHCPDWTHNASYNPDNSINSNFGCATATNEALMIADPMDLIEGRSDSTPDVQSDVAGITRYYNGEISPPVVSNTATSTSE